MTVKEMLKILADTWDMTIETQNHVQELVVLVVNAKLEEAADKAEKLEKNKYVPTPEEMKEPLSASKLVRTCKLQWEEQ